MPGWRYRSTLHESPLPLIDVGCSGVASGSQASVATLECSPLILAQAAPNSGILTRLQSPAQAFIDHAASTANRLRLFDLNQGGAGIADREEQLRVLVTAGRLVAPVHASQLHQGNAPQVVRCS